MPEQMNESPKGCVSPECRNHSEEVRDRILHIATELFYRYGIKTVCMDDIARRASLSKRTIYEQFADKEALLNACITFRRKQFEQLFEQILSTSPTAIDAILSFAKAALAIKEACCDRFFEEMKKYPRLQAIFDQERTIALDRFKKIFDRGVQEGFFVEDINTDILTNLAFEHTQLLIPPQTFARYPAMQVYEAILTVFLRGITTDKGRALFDETIKKYTDK